MNALEIEEWPAQFKASDWPEGVLKSMSAKLFTDCVFALRNRSSIPMWPSALPQAHVRVEGNSQHSTRGGFRLSTATDLHVATYARMISAMGYAERIPAIGGVGIYFNTNTPMIHIDMRITPLTWLRTKDGVYIYRESDPIKFYITLAEELKKAGE